MEESKNSRETMPFAGFLGNEETLRGLEQLLKKEKLPHAFLFQGEQGLGKKTLARLFAGRILALGQDPRQQALTHDLVLQGKHPDFVQIIPEGGARSFHIDTIRELVAGMYLAPNQSRFRVYLLADSHLMTEQAQNALLKALEEPPAHVIFLLTCDDGSSLLSTLISRVYPVRLSPLTLGQCLSQLEEQMPGTDREELRQSAYLSGGNLGLAEQLLCEENSRSALSGALALLEGAAHGGEYALLKALAPLEKSRPLAVRSLELAQEALAGVLREKTGSGKEPAPKRIQQLAGALSLEKLLQIYDALSQARTLLQGNVSAALALESFCAGLFSGRH